MLEQNGEFILKLSFDAQLLIKGEKTGIGWCAENVLLMLPKYKENVYQLNCFSLGYAKKKLENIEKYSKLGYNIKKCKWFHDVLYRIIWNIIYIPYSLFFGNDSDITVFFNYVIPPGVKGKKVVFVYDMVYKAFPETVRKKTRNLLNIALKKSCNRAEHIITISKFSKEEIIKHLNLSEEKISIMPCGVDLSLYHPGYSEEEIKRAIDKYNIPREYLLYLGTLEPRKNIDRLIQAYAQLKKESSRTPKLVLAGRKGWKYESIFEKVKALKMEEDIIFTGYVNVEDSPILLKGAKAFLFLSIYEGFGMPPLEAMACGTPVIVSNVSSLPEVVGDAGVLVDPFSINSIKEGMKYLIDDEKKRNELSARGIERAKQFTWDKSVRIVQKVFERL